MKRILFTNKSGFLANTIIENWSYRHRLFGLESVFFKRDIEELLPLDAIVHIPQYLHDVKKHTGVHEYNIMEVEMLHNIFKYFMQSDISTFIFISGANTFRYNAAYTPEERYLLNFVRRDPRVREKKIYVLRPCMIVGPGNGDDISVLYDLVRKGIPWPFEGNEGMRSYCSVVNLSFVAEQLIVNDDIKNGIYSVCDDEPVSTNELIGMISESAGKRSRIWRLPKALLRLPFMNHLKIFTEDFVVSNEEIKQALGIGSMPAEVKDMLTETENR